LADNEAKPDAVKIPQEVAAKQDRNLEARAETKTEAGTSSQRLPNWIVQFSKPDHHVSPCLGQRKASLLRNTFVVWAGRTFFVLATVANTIHTIQKIIVYWYRLLPTDTQNQFSKKNGSRSEPDALPPTTSVTGVRREGGAAIAMRMENEPPSG
jgi:hypothetical protein